MAPSFASGKAALTRASEVTLTAAAGPCKAPRGGEHRD